MAAQDKAQGTESSLIHSFIDSALDKNIKVIEELMHTAQNKDLVLREFVTCQRQACLIFIEGMSSSESLNHYILEPCMLRSDEQPPAGQMPMWLAKNAIAIGDVQETGIFQELVEAVLNGKSAVLVDGCAEALLLETRGYEKRGVERTNSESVVLGPQEGFVENLRTNITLVRRIVRSPHLVSEMMTVGTKLPTQLALMYLDGVASEPALNEVRRRIKSLNVDNVPGTGYLQQLIEDHPFALLPQMLETERPDRAASCVGDGQIAIIVDGSPYALVAPVTLFHLLHSSDDSFMRWQYGSFIRIIRTLGLAISLLLPGCYIAMTMFHSHMIPMDLLTSIAETRAKVPFPVLVEVLIMEFSFYLINEGGTRIPTLIGPALGIVGALILGQAAVAASIISPILIIIVALTGLGNYTVPSYSISLGMQLYRLALIFAGSLLGFYGIALALFMMTCHTCCLRSFGQPYMAPIAPHRPHNPDILLRLPLWMQKRRLFFAQRNSWLMKSDGRMRMWQGGKNK